MVLRLFKEEKISSEYGAELLGMSLAEFIELIKEKGIPFTHYTHEDWDRDKKAVDEMMKLGKLAAIFAICPVLKFVP